MSAGNRLMDDLSRVAGGALGALGGLRGEVEVLVRQRMERMIAGMDLVSREEFDAVQAMAQEARAKQEELEKKIAELEGKQASKPTPSRARRASSATKARTTKKPATKAAAQDGKPTDPQNTEE